MIKAVINTKTVRRNIKALKAKLNPGVRFCAVVKANAYGLGDVQVAGAVQDCVDWFAVAKIGEAVRLREIAKITKPILLFGICDDLELAIKNNITVTAGSPQDIHLITTAAKQFGRISVHIKVNTGMNRYGISTPLQLKSILAVAEKCPEIVIDGMYTHMSHEIDNIPIIDKQLAKFAPFRAMMKRAYPNAIIHSACSGSSEYKPAQFDMVRVGKLMYGGFNGYKTAVTITSRICAVQHIQKGCGVNYGAKFVADKPMTIGVVSCGYADCGFFNFGHTTHVYVGDIPCKILGVVCMDTFAIDISSVPNPIGKTVTIIADDNNSSIINFVQRSGISACLLLCSFNFMRTNKTFK